MTLVIGGGIGGLSAAYYLLKHSRSNVFIAEASKAAGGWIQTVKDPSSGLIFEKGPRTLRIKGNIGANSLSLIDELGLASKVKPITLDHPSTKNRLIYVNQQLYYLPSDFPSIFKKIPPFNKSILSAIVKDLLKPKKACSDDSIYEFVERRFGHEIADFLISPMICGICAGNSKNISVKLLMPSLFESEQKYGSVSLGFVKDILSKRNSNLNSEPLDEINTKAKKEHWSTFGLEDGMSSLPKVLSENIIKNGGKLMFNSEITYLSLKKNSVKYQIGNNTTEECEHVISSLPAKSLSSLVKQEHPWLAEQLLDIPFVTVGVVNVAYKSSVLKHNAFGVLVPPSQNIPVLGIVFDSCNFPQGDWTVLTIMMGGFWFEKYFGTDPKPEYLLETSLNYNRNILGITEIPDVYHIKIMKDCIPQYIIGHHRKVDNIFNYIKEKNLPLSLIGSSYKGIGVNDVILSAKAAVEQLVSKQTVNE